MFNFQSQGGGTNWFLWVYWKISLQAGFPSMTLLWKCNAFLGPKLNLQLPQRFLGLKCSPMSGVFLPLIFLRFSENVQVLTEKLLALLPLPLSIGFSSQQLAISEGTWRPRGHYTYRLPSRPPFPGFTQTFRQNLILTLKLSLNPNPTLTLY